MPWSDLKQYEKSSLNERRRRAWAIFQQEGPCTANDRIQVWKLLVPKKDLPLDVPCEDDSQIELDVRRTFVDALGPWASEEREANLTRLLRAWSNQHPNGYFQGLSFIAAGVLIGCNDDLDFSFRVLSYLMDVVGPVFGDDHLHGCKREVRATIHSGTLRLPLLWEWLHPSTSGWTRHCPSCCLSPNNTDSEQTCMFFDFLHTLFVRWYCTLFVLALPLEDVWRVWDGLLCCPNGFDMCHGVALAAVKCLEVWICQRLREEVKESGQSRVSSTKAMTIASHGLPERLQSILRNADAQLFSLQMPREELAYLREIATYVEEQQNFVLGKKRQQYYAEQLAKRLTLTTNQVVCLRSQVGERVNRASFDKLSNRVSIPPEMAKRLFDANAEEEATSLGDVSRSIRFESFARMMADVKDGSAFTKVDQKEMGVTDAAEMQMKLQKISKEVDKLCRENSLLAPPTLPKMTRAPMWLQTMSGILEKRSPNVLRAWQKRRVVLSNGRLAYFKPHDNPEEAMPLGIIDLTWQGAWVKPRASFNGFTLNFHASDRREFEFRVESGKPDSWIEAISWHIAKLSPVDPLPTSLRKPKQWKMYP